MHRETCTYIVIYRERDLHIYSNIYRETSEPLRGDTTGLSLYSNIYIERPAAEDINI